MTVFIVYAALFIYLVYRTGLFGIYRDGSVTKSQAALLFALKALAVPVLFTAYGGWRGELSRYDAGKYYHDAHFIGSYGLSHPGFYVRLLAGFQGDAQGSDDHKQVLTHLLNWNTGRTKDFLYNDNRVVIRVHALLDPLTFGSYLAHALFSCLFSFAGMALLCRALSGFTGVRSLLLLIVACIWPSLWFYTGGVLKEGLVMLLMGWSAWSVFSFRMRASGVLSVMVALVASFFLKPHVLLPVCAAFALYRIFLNTDRWWRIPAFAGTMAVMLMFANLLAREMKGRSLYDAMDRQQRTFAIAARGGIFLSAKDKYVRMDYDTTALRPAGGDSLYTMRAGRAYSYWLDAHPGDSLYCQANADTLTVYRLEDWSAPGRSNIDVSQYRSLPLLKSAYFGIVHPLLLPGKSRLQWVASLENVLLIVMILLAFRGMTMDPSRRFTCFVFCGLFIALCSFFAYTAPNTGAIMRYRAPVVPLLVCAALVAGARNKRTNSIYSESHGKQSAN